MERINAVIRIASYEDVVARQAYTLWPTSLHVCRLFYIDCSSSVRRLFFISPTNTAIFTHLHKFNIEAVVSNMVKADIKHSMELFIQPY